MTPLCSRPLTGLMVSNSLRLVGTYQEALVALADPTRRGVFELLVSGPMSVAELAERFPVSRPAVSQHLRVLKRAGLVVDRRDGTRRIYQLDPTGLDALRSYLDRFWGALAAFKVAAERDARATDQRRSGDEPNDMSGSNGPAAKSDQETGEGTWR